ncbi:MAG: helix-turn-helix transcriptional regulator [Thaumarchaeota archaeon]|nr:helix-turn-helix transcriptional regulator [Nitrososphaerota archaeon]
MRLSDEELKSRLLKALSDENMRRILLSTAHEAKPVSTLSKECSIPLSTAYRYIHDLIEAGLMGIERSVITEDGKRYELYRSLVKSISLNLNGNAVELEVEPREEDASKFYRLWSSLRKVK